MTTASRRYFFAATGGFFVSACLSSVSSCASGNAPGITEPSAKTSVGVALTWYFCPSAAVFAIGVGQSPLLSGSLPVSNHSSQALLRSGGTPDLRRLARRFGMQRIDRKEERVDRHVVEALHLGFEALAERAIRVGEDVQLARTVALDLLEREFERQRADVDAIELAQPLVGEIDSCDACRKSSRRIRT